MQMLIVNQVQIVTRFHPLISVIPILWIDRDISIKFNINLATITDYKSQPGFTCGLWILQVNFNCGHVPLIAFAASLPVFGRHRYDPG